MGYKETVYNIEITAFEAGAIVSLIRNLDTELRDKLKNVERQLLNVYDIILQKQGL